VKSIADWHYPYTIRTSKRKASSFIISKECYSMKLDLLTNATIVDDAMKFVQESKLKLKSSEENKELKEHNHNKELERKQE
jgi:hypothetical protein